MEKKMNTSQVELNHGFLLFNKNSKWLYHKEVLQCYACFVLQEFLIKHLFHWISAWFTALGYNIPIFFATILSSFHKPTGHALPFNVIHSLLHYFLDVTCITLVQKRSFIVVPCKHQLYSIPLHTPLEILNLQRAVSP